MSGEVAAAGRGGVGRVQRVLSPPRHAGRLARITAEQLVELAGFVDRSSPHVLQRLLSMLA
jgi:hypothetical protein